MAVFGFGIVVGLLLTPERKAFAHKWIWLAGVLAFLIFLPNLLWNIHYHWPFVQLMHNIRPKAATWCSTPLHFILEQMLMVNPFALPLWLAGLAWLFFGREGRRYRVLGWAYVVDAGVLHAPARQGLLRCARLSHAVRRGRRGLRAVDRAHAAAHG